MVSCQRWKQWEELRLQRVCGTDKQGLWGVSFARYKAPSCPCTGGILGIRSIAWVFGQFIGRQDRADGGAWGRRSQGDGVT